MASGTKRERRRWPYFPRQALLLFAAFGIFIGSVLPWALVLGQSLRGSPLAVSWTLWAGLMTIAAALVPWRIAFALSALAGGGTAVALAVWQTARILDRCPFSLDCLPGPGLGLMAAGGGAALYLAGRDAFEALRRSPPRS
jgi:hypothetical protein